MSYSDLPVSAQRQIATYNAAVAIACRQLASLSRVDFNLVLTRVDDLAARGVSEMSDEEIAEYMRAIDAAGNDGKAFSLFDA